MRDPFMFLQKGCSTRTAGSSTLPARIIWQDSPRTTCVACIVQNNIAYWVHSGDSRLYLLRNGKVLAQTRDHSRVRNAGRSGCDQRRADARTPRPQQDLRLPGWPANAGNRVFPQDDAGSRETCWCCALTASGACCRPHPGGFPEDRRSGTCRAAAAWPGGSPRRPACRQPVDDRRALGRHLQRSEQRERYATA
jgi:hypothetical protein